MQLSLPSAVPAPPKNCLFFKKYKYEKTLPHRLLVTLTNKVHIYLEYQTVCPLVGIGTRALPPFPQANVSPPPEPKGETHSPTGEGVWGPNLDGLRKSLVLCLLCVRIPPNFRIFEDNLVQFFLSVIWSLY